MKKKKQISNNLKNFNVRNILKLYSNSIAFFENTHQKDTKKFDSLFLNGQGCIITKT